MFTPTLIGLLLALPQAAPKAPPSRCTIRMTAKALEVVVGRKVVASHPWDPADLPSRNAPDHPTALVLHRTNDPQRTLVGVRENWSGMAADGLGNLFEVRCDATPSVRRVLHVDGVDFGQAVALPDGRLVFGGVGGLKVLEPDLMMLLPLTIPPGYGKGCWTAVDDQPTVVASDVAPLQYKAGEILFDRGGPCGYEAEMTHTPLALDLTTGVVRSVVRASDTVVDHAGTVLVGYGGDHCEPTPGDSAVWKSTDDGDHFAHTPLAGLPAGHVGPVADLALVATPAPAHPKSPKSPKAPKAPTPGPDAKDAEASETILALFDVCENGGSSTGGELFKTSDGQTWTPVVFPAPTLDKLNWDSGSAVRAIEARGKQLFALRYDDRGKPIWWRSLDLGATWKRGTPPSKGEPVPPKLAAELGVLAVYSVRTDKARGLVWASTSDGLFRKRLPVKPDPKAPKPQPLGAHPLEAQPWLRVFPTQL